MEEVGLPHNLTVEIDSKDLCRRFSMALREQIPQDRAAEEAEEAREREKERNKQQRRERRTTVQEGAGEEGTHTLNSAVEPPQASPRSQRTFGSGVLYGLLRSGKIRTRT